MTTEQMTRCKHCGTLYAHVTSGSKLDESSPVHCGPCNTAVLTATPLDKE